MLTAGIASTDMKSSGALHASLEQTGVVKSVVEWVAPNRGGWQLGADEAVPDVVLLDLSVEPEPYFAFASQLRKQRSTVRVVACSMLEALDSELLLQAMRMGVQDFLPRPIDLAKLRETLNRFEVEFGERESAAREGLIVVMGAKGGAGASTLSVNLAAQLAHVTKKPVGLVDLGFPLGHLSLLLDLRPQFTIRDAMENLERLDSHLLSGLLARHKSGVEVLAGATHVEEWQNLSPAAIRRLVNVAQSLFDYVVVDFGAAYSGDWKPVLEAARAVLVVTQADVPSLWSLERHLTDLVAMGLDAGRVRVVVNRWQRQDDEALEKFQKNTGRSIFAKLPNDYEQVNQATNMGVPIYRNHNDPLTLKYRKLATNLAGVSVEAAETKRGGMLTNLFAKR
jgi:pilus assembly protein CpaE